MESNSPQDSLRKIERRNFNYRILELAVLSIILASVLTLLIQSNKSVVEHRAQTEQNIRDHRDRNEEVHAEIERYIKCVLLVERPFTEEKIDHCVKESKDRHPRPDSH